MFVEMRSIIAILFCILCTLLTSVVAGKLLFAVDAILFESGVFDTWLAGGMLELVVRKWLPLFVSGLLGGAFAIGATMILARSMRAGWVFFGSLFLLIVLYGASFFARPYLDQVAGQVAGLEIFLSVAPDVLIASCLGVITGFMILSPLLAAPTPT